ncbi:hypothetical protein [Photobacterium damselae]|uniref:hypothetical protein n=1 Tax=Photobacterium damselae TaxID=38293 RepID=UPI002F424695
MSKQPHLLIEPGQIAKYIVVCGEPNRVNRIAEQLLTDWQVIAENRVYRRALKTLIEQGLVTKQKNGELIIINQEGLKQYLDELE